MPVVQAPTQFALATKTEQVNPNGPRTADRPVVRSRPSQPRPEHRLGDLLPQKVVVLCVDEKTQIQALDRTQPQLPMGLGCAQGVTHGHVRHGTTTLFAALDVATGKITGQCRQRHRHQEYLAFLRRIDKDVPDDLDIHLVVDNYATHKHAKVRAWLARRPRYHVHYTPTYASWLNQVERWFGIITQQAFRRGTFSSAPQLRGKINDFVADYNTRCSPFAWSATAESILAKVERIRLFISRTAH